MQGPLVRQMLLQCARQGLLRHVLNAGAGEGLYSPELLRCEGLVQLVELDPSYATFPRLPAAKRQEVVAGSVTSIPFASASMDLVVCTEVLEHVENDGLALNEMCRVIRPGGWLLLSTPTPPAEFDPHHVREGYLVADLATLLRDRGFEMVRVEFCMFAVYRLALKAFRRFGRLPHHLVRLAVLIDQCSRWGPPMDMVVLARLSTARV